MPKRIYVGNLPDGATEAELRKLFSGYGSVDEVHIDKRRGVASIEIEGTVRRVPSRLSLRGASLDVSER